MNIYIDYTIRLLMAFFCGAVLGAERKTRQHTVGLRTLILISVSSCLLTMLSTLTANGDFGVTASGDCTRVTAGIVTGIGFLGAGAIIRTGLNIRGLTTAAIIWSASALGVASGAGQYFLTTVTLAIIIVCLFIFSKIEYKLFPQEKSKILTIVYATLISDGESERIKIADVQRVLVEHNLIEHDINITQSVKDEKTILKFWVKVPSKVNLSLLTEKLLKTGNVTKIALSDG